MLYNVKYVKFRDGVTDTRIFKNAIYTGWQKKTVFTEEEKKRRTEEQKKDDLRRSLARTKQKIYDIVRNQEWEYFVTLTFDGKKVNRYDYAVCSKKLSQWINNVRKKVPLLKYMFVPEKHKDGAIHFHGIISNSDGLKLMDSGKRDHGRIIYNIGNYKLGFSTATKVKNNAAVVRYITKYITKEVEIEAKGRKRYWCSKFLERPHTELGLLDPMERGLLWQELADTCEYKNIIQNKFNEVMYFEHKPDELDEMYIKGLLSRRKRCIMDAGE